MEAYSGYSQSQNINLIVFQMGEMCSKKTFGCTNACHKNASSAPGHLQIPSNEKRMRALPPLNIIVTIVCSVIAAPTPQEMYNSTYLLLKQSYLQLCFT